MTLATDATAPSWLMKKRRGTIQLVVVVPVPTVVCPALEGLVHRVDSQCVGTVERVARVQTGAAGRSALRAEPRSDAAAPGSVPTRTRIHAPSHILGHGGRRQRKAPQVRVAWGSRGAVVCSAFVDLDSPCPRRGCGEALRRCQGQDTSPSPSDWRNGPRKRRCRPEQRRRMAGAAQEGKLSPITGCDQD